MLSTTLINDFNFPLSKEDVVKLLREIPEEDYIEALKLLSTSYNSKLPDKLMKILRAFNDTNNSADPDEKNRRKNLSQLKQKMVLNYLQLSSDDKQIEFINYADIYKALLRPTALETFKALLDAHNISPSEWNPACRTTMKPGRFFKYFYPGATPQECEDFVAVCQQWEKRHENLDIRELTGDDILQVYLAEYNVGGSGTLQSSCMNRSSRNHFMQVYVDMGIKIVAFFDADEPTKIRARALLWPDVETASGETVTVMDRIYSTIAEDESFMKNYAEKNNYWYKEHQDFSSSTQFMVPSPTGYEQRNELVIFKSSGSKAVEWPYLDTFCYGSCDMKVVGNNSQHVNGNIPDNRKVYRYRKTGGGRE